MKTSSASEERNIDRYIVRRPSVVQLRM